MSPNNVGLLMCLVMCGVRLVLGGGLVEGEVEGTVPRPRSSPMQLNPPLNSQLPNQNVWIRTLNIMKHFPFLCVCVFSV